MKQGNYKETSLFKEQYDFIYDWLNTMNKNKNISTQSYANLKLFCERYFFYICGDDMHQIMKQVEGLKGDRWNHNISVKHLKELEKGLEKRPFYLDEIDMLNRIEKLRTHLNIQV